MITFSQLIKKVLNIPLYQEPNLFRDEILVLMMYRADNLESVLQNLILFLFRNSPFKSENFK